LVAFRRAYPRIRIRLAIGNTGTAELGLVEGEVESEHFAEYRNSEIATTRLGKWSPARPPHTSTGSLVATSVRRLNIDLKQKPGIREIIILLSAFSLDRAVEMDALAAGHRGGRTLGSDGGRGLFGLVPHEQR
jgi:hypothetical protein